LRGREGHMRRRSVGGSCILALCLVTISCKKLEPFSSNASTLMFEPAKFADAIPDEYGVLIGVTQNPQFPAAVGLWFQRPDRTVTAVFVNVVEGRIYEKALRIPRK
jgi:hypothetical protein